jgi:hypothetical protein
MERIAIDTNVLIYAFKKNSRAVAILNQKEIFLSFITVIEILSFPILTAKDEEVLLSFFTNCTIIPNTPELQRRVIELRKKYKLKIPDAFIAATAIENKLPLFSGDSIFDRIKELNFIHVEF